MVSSIERFALNDGPGIRTLVFLKGCHLRCKWCCNPENLSKEPNLGIFKERCIGCGNCIEACSYGAISISDGSMPATDRSLCVGCGACTQLCHTQARIIYGKMMTADEVFTECLRDEVFYSTSGGGITLSGGEVAMHWEFAASILSKCKQRGINTAIETSGFSEWNHLKTVIELCDSILFDIKTMDPILHKEGVGVSNELILANAVKIVESGAKVVFRIPLIPGYSATVENIERTAEFIKDIGGEKVDLLPYHRLAISKYQSLGLQYNLKGERLKIEDIQKFKARIEAKGMFVRIEA